MPGTQKPASAFLCAVSPVPPATTRQQWELRTARYVPQDPMLHRKEAPPVRCAGPGMYHQSMDHRPALPAIPDTSSRPWCRQRVGRLLRGTLRGRSRASTRYQICDPGTYNEVAALTQCLPCPPGTMTANFGSKSSSKDCVSPTVNFVMVRKNHHRSL